MKIKKIICLTMVIFTIFMLTSCSFDPDKSDLSPYIELGDIETFTRAELVSKYEDYRAKYVSTNGGYYLSNGDIIDMYITAEKKLDETSYEKIENWTFYDKQLENYIVGEKEENRDFDKCLKYTINKKGEVSNGKRTIKLGSAFSFEYEITKDGYELPIGTVVKFTILVTKFTPTGKYSDYYSKADYSDSYANSYVGVFFDKFESNKSECSDGDFVFIDYSGVLSGTNKEVSGAKGTNYPIRIGDGNLWPVFESMLIGHKAGEEIEVLFTVPSSYEDTEIAGKDVIFTVKINKIIDVEKTLKEKTSYDSYYELVYNIKLSLYARDIIIDWVKERSQIKAYPDAMYKQYEKLARDFVYQNVDDFIAYEQKTYGITYSREKAFKYLYSREDMEAYIQEGAKAEVSSILTAYAIKKALGFEYTEEDYKEELVKQTIAENLESGSVLTEKEVEAKYTKDRLKGYFIMEKCADILYERIEGVEKGLFLN